MWELFVGICAYIGGLIVLAVIYGLISIFWEWVTGLASENYVYKRTSFITEEMRKIETRHNEDIERLQDQVSSLRNIIAVKSHVTKGRKK